MKTIAVLVAALVIKSLDAASLKAVGAPDQSPDYVVAHTPAAASASASASASPAPQPPSLDALHINFEIKNFNYYDLTRETCPQKVKVHKTKKGGKPPAPSAKGGKTKRHPLFSKDPLAHMDAKLPVIKADEVKAPNVTAAVEDVHGHSDDIAKQMRDKASGRDRQASGLPWMEDKDDKDDESFLQTDVGACAAMPDLAETKSTECSTVMDVLRTAIEKTIKDIISCLQHSAPMGPAAAPGAAPPVPPAPPVPVVLPVSTLPAAPAGAVGLVPLPPQAFLQFRASGPASASPAPGPAAAVADVKVFVTFAQGREMEGGRSTMVEVTFIDRPANGLDDVAFVKPFLEQAIGSKLFHKQIRKALHQVTGIKPKLRGVVMATKAIEQWAVNTCEEHIKGIVGQFSMHYTRNQVPMALYNECTNFMTRMSFSHDYVLDPMDTVRCRRATATFANHWDHGEHAKDSDFADMCQNACEAKFGRNAPKCNIAVGANGLLNQPL